MNEKFKKLYSYLSSNNLTDLDENEFFSKYSDVNKSKEIHSYLKENGMTDLDESEFHNSYFGGVKKKEESMDSSSGDGSSASPKSLDDITAEQERLKNMPTGARMDELSPPSSGTETPQPKPVAPPPIEEMMGKPAEMQVPTMASDATSTGPKPQIDSELSTMLDIVEEKQLLKDFDPVESEKRYDAETERLKQKTKEVGDNIKAKLPPGAGGEPLTSINPVSQALADGTEEIPMLDRRYDEKLDINKDGKIDQADVEAYDKKPIQEKPTVNPVQKPPATPKEVAEKGKAIQDELELGNTEGRKKDAEYIKNIEDQKKKDEEIKKNDTEFLDSVKNVDLSEVEDGKERADYINETFGSRGFVAIPSVFGNSVTVMDVSGNTLMVDLDNAQENTQLQSFLIKNASVDLRPKEEVSRAEKEAQEFFKERGLNYYAVTKANEEMEMQKSTAELAENLMANRNLQFQMSDAEKRKYPMLFERNNLGLLAAKPNSELEKALDIAEDKYDELSDVIGFNVFDDEVRTAMEDFDIHMAKKQKKVKTEAANLNDRAKLAYAEINNESQKYFGKPINEVTAEDIKTANDVGRIKYIQERIEGIEFVQQEAADSYLDAATYFDLKFEKDLNAEFVDNWGGFQEEWVSGWNRGEAGDVILKYTMGMGDETFESKQAMAQAISESLIQADKKGTSRAMHRFAKARGFKDVMSLLGSDPLEFTTQLAASSMAQMMPYGWKLVGGGAAGGAAVGAGYGALFGTAAGPPGTAAGAIAGATTGAINGARLGFAATSFAMEYTNSVLDAARDFGYDPKKPEEMVKALDDERVWKQGAATGAARGIPIAVIDYLSAGLAGKVFGTATKAFSSPVRRVASIGMEQIAFGPVAESLGEASAIASTRVLADAGFDAVQKQEYDIKEIMAEGLGAMGNNSVNLAINLKQVTNKNAKLELAESLTDIDNFMKETASTKKILSFAEGMKNTGQIDETTYQQIVENVNIKNQTDEYIQNGNPELVISEEQVQETEKAADAQTTVAETELTQPKAIESADQQAAETTTETTTETEVDQVDTQADGQQSIIDADVSNEQQEITERGVKPKKRIGDKIVDALGNIRLKKRYNLQTIKRKKLVKNRISQLIKAREVYSKNKEVFGKQISEINNEINTIVTSGKIPPKTELIKLPTTGQVYKVDGKSYNSRRFKKFLETASNEKIDKSQITVANPNEEIKNLIDKKNNEIFNIKPDAIQEQQTETSVLRPGEVSQETGQETQVELQGVRQGQQAEVEITQEEKITELGNRETVLTESLTTLEEGSKEFKKAQKELKEVQAEKQVLQDTETAVQEEAQVLAEELGLVPKPKSKKKLRLRKQQTEDIAVEDIGKQEEYINQMNEMSEDVLSYETPTYENKPTVNPMQESLVSNEDKQAALKELGLTEEQTIVDLNQFSGIPMQLGISDVLATGNIKNAEGQNMQTHGGLMYNVLGPNKDFAWANVKKESSQKQLDNAIKMYQDNKATFEKFWADNPQYKGLVPQAIMRMGDDAFISNEANYRFIMPTVMKANKGNRIKALNAFKNVIAKTNVARNKKERVALNKFLESRPDIKSIDQLLQAVMEDANQPSPELSLTAKGFLFSNIFSDKGKKGGGKVIASALFPNNKDTNRAKFSYDVVYEALSEPSMRNVEQGDIVGIVGIDVLNPGIAKPDHPNYNFGLKGKFIGFLSNPTNGINLFPEYFAKAGVLSKNEKDTAATRKAQAEGKIGKDEKIEKPGTAPKGKKLVKQIPGTFADLKALVGAVLTPKGQQTKVQQVSAMMRLAFPNITVTTNKAEFDAAIESDNVLTKKNKEGEVILGIQEGGKIVINPEATSIATPIHEFAHVWVTYMKELGGKQGQAILNKGLNLVKNTAYYNNALEQYGEFDADGNLLNEDLVLEEALVEAIATKGENISNASLKSKFQNWLKGMYEYLKGKTTAAFKKNNQKEFAAALENLTFDEIQEMALGDLFSGEMIGDFKELQKAFDKNTPAKARFERLGGMSAQEIISKGRELGYTEDSIMAVVQSQNPGLSKTKILEMMSFDVENGKVSSFKEVRETAAFGNVPGGINAGIQMLNDIKLKVEEYATTGRRKTEKQMRVFAQKELKNHPTYKQITADAQLQKQLQSDLDSMLNVSKNNANLKAKFAKLKTQISAMKLKQGNLNNVKKRLKSIIREDIPATEYSKAQLEKMVAIIDGMTTTNFDGQVTKLENFILKKETQMKTSLLKKSIKKFKRLGKKVVSDSGRAKSKRIVDEAGRRYFKNMANVLETLVGTNAKKKLELKQELFQLNPDNDIVGLSTKLQEVQKKASQGNEVLTQPELDLLSKYEAYNTFEKVESMSLKETEALLEGLENEEQSLRNRLSNKLALEAEKNRKLKDEATKEVEESFGDTVFAVNEDGSVQLELSDLNTAEQNKYEVEVIKQLGKDKTGEVTIDGKKFVVELDKKGNQIIKVEKPKLLSKDQLAKKYESLSDRLRRNKGKGMKKNVAEAFKWGRDAGKNFLKNPSKTLMGMAYKINGNVATMMRYLDGKNKFFEKHVYRNLNRMFEGWKGGVQTQRDLMNHMADKIFGGKKGIKAIQNLKQIKANHDIKIKPFKDINGKIVKEQNFSGSQLMRIYALSKNPEQKRKMMENNEGEFKLTEESFKQIEGILGPDVKTFVDQVVDYLSNDYFQSIDNVYQDVNNVGLNQIENYFPTKTDMTNAQENQMANLIDEGDYAGTFNAQYASALKQRTDSKGKVELMHGFFGELDNHFESMEKFKNYAPGVKEINTVLGTPAVDAALQMTGFKGHLKTLLNIAINPDAEQNIFKANKIADTLFRNFSLAVLGFRAIQVAKQASSFINAFADYKYNRNSTGVKGAAQDTIMFMVDAAKVLATLPKQIKKAKEISATFRDRYENNDIYSLETGRGKLPSRRSLAGKKLDQAAGFFTKVGDTLGVMGYMINYNRDIANGMNERQAAEKFNDYNETQQTRRPQDLNVLQASNNIFMRGLLMFGSTSILQLNKALQVFDNIVRKQKGKFWKTPTSQLRELALNVGVANALFYIAGNFLKFTTGDDEDKEEFTKEMFKYLTGQQMLITSLPLMGSSLSYLSQVAEGEVNPFMMKQPVSPFTKFLMDVSRGAAKGETEKIARAVMGTAFGINTQPFTALYDLFKDSKFSATDAAESFGISKSSQRHRFENTKLGRLREVSFPTYQQVKAQQRKLEANKSYIRAQQLKAEGKQIKKEAIQKSVTDMKYK